ncbi:MAG: nicotinamide-nucleotide adenylyltransferase [Candidatus Bathyarchaeia archaeon]
MFKRALFVGRFQPFHNGHLYAIQLILKEAEELIIVIGSAEKSHELDNPFTAGERMEMIRRALKSAGVNPSRFILVPVPDVQAHTTWVSQVVAYTPSFDIVYTNQSLTRRLLLEAGYEVREIPLYRRSEYSATEIRRRILEEGEWESLVPKEVYDFIKAFGGDERIRDLARTDKVEGGSGGEGKRD